MNALRASFRRVSYAWAALTGLALLIIANVFASPSFSDPTTWAGMLAVMMPFMLSAMAQTPAIMSGNGGLDLSVGPFAGMIGVLIVKFIVPHHLDSPITLLFIVVLAGALSGLLIGYLISFARIPPIIVTLGAYLAYNGLAIYILPTPGGTAPHWLVRLAGSYGPVPGMLVVLAVVASAWTALQHTAFRRNLLAIGGDARAAYTAGVNVAAVRTVSYIITGVLSAIVGLVFVASLQSAAPTATTPYTLISLAGAALGGVSLAGGRGGMLGAAAGGALLFLASNLLSLAHVSVFYIQIFYGVILLLALGVNALLDARRKATRTREFEALRQGKDGEHLRPASIEV